jgi:ATPase subunit of ABC transporter with duplicated ATPase domains
LDRTVNRIFELKDTKVTDYVGGYSDYAAWAEVNLFGAKQAKA